MIQFFLKSLFVIVVMFGAAVGSTVYFLYQGNAGESIDIVIPRGATLGQVALDLHRQGVIRYPQFFKLTMRFTNGASKLRAGEFQFKKDMKMIDALYVVYQADPILHAVTIPEGWNLRQIAAILAEKKLGDEKTFLSLASSEPFLKSMKIKATSAEGYLFPDTYSFSRLDSEERILTHMIQQFRAKFEKEYTAEMQSKGWKLDELVTLASIIEKETGAKEEREIISSVFHNRLKKKMRLQSDPTTIYGIPNFDGNLRKADLLRYSPYNTYVIPALPVGPIANPGLDSLVAALRPANTNYLYFVANNNGRHIFSETYGEHSSHVDNYQKNPSQRRAPKQVARKKKK